MLQKRTLIFGGAAVFAVVAAIATAVVVQLLRSDSPNLATQAPAIPTRAAATAPGATTTAPAATVAPAANLPAGVLHFVIETGSKAKYVVREKLAGVPVSTDAVGETSTMTGDIFLTASGLSAGQKSTFKVDLRTLRSDEGRRDQFIRQDTLRTNQYPMAEFTVENVTGFPAGYTEGQEVSLSLSGSMTVHGVTKPIIFQVKARRSGESLTAIADTDFKMTDFGITPPDVQLAKAEDGVHLQVTIVARLVAS